MTTSNNFDVMDASVRQCQFEQSWAQCKREAHRQQVSFIFQFQPENVKHRLETLVAAILRVYISTQIWWIPNQLVRFPDLLGKSCAALQITIWSWDVCRLHIAQSQRACCVSNKTSGTVVWQMGLYIICIDLRELGELYLCLGALELIEKANHEILMLF